MSKAVSKAIDTLTASFLKTSPEDADVAAAVGTLVGEGLSFLERISLALEMENERQTVLAAGAGMVVGELAKFEPLISPELAVRGIAALEKLAGITHGGA